MRRDHEQTLWNLSRGHRLLYAAAMGAMGLGHVFLLGVPQISRIAIDDVIGGTGDIPAWMGTPADLLGLGELWIAGLGILLLTACGGGFHYLRGRWAAIASEGIVRGLRDRLYGHLEELPASYHDGAETGDLVQRCSSDVETVRVFMSGQVVEIGRTVLMLVAVLPMMLALDVEMTLVSVVSFPLLFVAALFFFRRIRGLFKESDEAEGRLTATIQENLTGIRVVRAFARQEFESEKFGARNADYRDRNYKLLRLLGHYYGLSDVVCMSQMGLVLILGSNWMLDGRVSVGTLFAFLTYVGMVIWPVRHLGRVLTDAGKAMVSLGRIREVLETRPEDDLDEGPAAGPARLRGEIEFENLSFAFGEGSRVLDGVSFHLRAGETLALLGPPGSGKSTLVHLLLRLYDYREGSIRLDGIELSELPRRYVRSRIGVVLQEPFLYSLTIGANVRVGRKNASERAVTDAAAAAAIHGSIEDFEDGYETLVGERGVTLSGGQRQRLAIARALLKSPDVLVLDDALSAVDTRTEAEILASLREKRGGGTNLVIAHRISSVMHADLILVLEKGRIEQRGTHRDLVRVPGPYRRLYEIQGALEDDAGGSP